MAASNSSKTTPDESLSHAKEFVTLIDEIIPQRLGTIHNIRKFADIIEKEKTRANSARKMGIASMALGAIMCGAGFALTGKWTVHILLESIK